MKKYLSFFRIRFLNSLQYRTAALAGIATQFFWGAMSVLLFRAFYLADPASFPMEFAALSSYLWLRQAFLALINVYSHETELFDAIESGNVAYEICRPVSLYGMWFSRTAANRVAKATLRALPILCITVFLPAPYRLSLPANGAAALWFLPSMVLCVANCCAFGMILYFSTFFLLRSSGICLLASSVTELLSGQLIPLPFFPDAWQKVLTVLPFASLQDVPFRIWSGDLYGKEMLFRLALQLFWFLCFVGIGKGLERGGLRKAVIHGG